MDMSYLNGLWKGIRSGMMYQDMISTSTRTTVGYPRCVVEAVRTLLCVLLCISSLNDVRMRNCFWFCLYTLFVVQGTSTNVVRDLR